MFSAAPGPSRASQPGVTSLGLAPFVLFVLLAFCWAVPADAQIAGRTEYNGTESGKIYVEAFRENDATFEKLEVSMINPGPFSFMNVEEGSYTVIAYIDTDDNGRLDSEETWVEYGMAVTVPPGNQDVVLDLDNPDAGEGAGDGDDDNGCCAVVSGRRGTPAAAVLLLAMVLLHRRRRRR